MFDIGFSELLMIAIVALVVIGPERLPGVARNVGRFTGRLQRYVNDIKRDFNREIEFDEIRRLQQEMETTVQTMQESMRVVESTLQQEVARQQSTLPMPVAAANTVPAEEAPALTKPRVRKKRDPQAEEPAKPVQTATPQAPAIDDEQYRLF
jgi:sec-independent protein translocase protein TatB